MSRKEELSSFTKLEPVTAYATSKLGKLSGEQLSSNKTLFIFKEVSTAAFIKSKYGVTV
jgi:hypothetical protein